MAYDRRVTPSLADRLWQDDLDLADACRRHPFVRGLADGSLPLARYRDYVAQDAFFLRAFADAYRLAGERASDADGRRLFERLREGVADELRLHARTANSLGIDLAHTVPSDATLAYTEFLIAVAATQPEAHTAAAMLPCLRLYAWLGQRLSADLQPSSPFADWVRTYADPGFDALWRQLAPRLEGAKADALAPLHRRAMHLELRFFAAAWGGDAPAAQPAVALTIAGSDPSGGAGIQADLKTFHRHGVYGQAVLTLLTAQNTRGVQGVFATPLEQVLAQVRSVGSDLGAKATKTGALGNAGLVAALAAELGRQRGTFGRLVVDPVLVSKHGHRLADDTVVGALLAELLPLAAVVTPNRFEATAMTGIEVHDAATAEMAIARLLATGVGAVVVKDVPGLGGDLLGTAAGAREVFATPRQSTPHRHGSGCTFSAAVTARLARGDELRDAIASACDYVSRAIASAPAFGEVGPLNHWA